MSSIPSQGCSSAHPTAHRASYLEPWEAALFLESARTYRANVEAGAFDYMYPLVATFLLTGGRRAEVLGLMVDDVTLGKGKRLGRVTFRPNEFRRLKTTKSERSVPLWPQLERILRSYFADREQSGGLGSLLFPAVGEGPERMLYDIRKPLDRIAIRAGLEPVRLHQLRHTYTAARLTTLDGGYPVSPYLVARELGHSSSVMIESVYGHVHSRHDTPRTEVVSFHVEDWENELGDRLVRRSPTTKLATP